MDNIRCQWMSLAIPPQQTLLYLLNAVYQIGKLTNRHIRAYTGRTSLGLCYTGTEEDGVIIGMSLIEFIELL